MNGIGLSGTLDKLGSVFHQAKQQLAPDGQLIFDSSNISYVYEQLPSSHYYGEMSYRYEYDHKFGPWFQWLYVDMDTMTRTATQHGFHTQVIAEDSSGHYVAKAKMY